MAGSVTRSKRSTNCRFYTNGSCVYGENCRNLHSNPHCQFLNQSQTQLPAIYQNEQNSIESSGMEELPFPGSCEMETCGDQFFNATFNQHSFHSSHSHVNSFQSYTSLDEQQTESCSNISVRLSQAAKTFIPKSASVGQAADLGVQQEPVHHVNNRASFGSVADAFFDQTPALSSVDSNFSLHNGGLGHEPWFGSSPTTSPDGSPSTHRRRHVNVKAAPPSHSTPNAKKSLGPVIQENVGGTVYYYNSEEFTPQAEAIPPPSFTMFHSTPMFIKHMKLKGPPSFFMCDELKTLLLHRQQMCHAVHNPQISAVPPYVDNYDNLLDLEVSRPHDSFVKSSFGYQSTCYRATHKREGTLHCLRRVHNFRLNSSLNGSLRVLVERWSKVYHPNIVRMKEVFTTKGFGDSSIVVSYDYLPGAETLMAQKFSSDIALLHNGFSADLVPNGTPSTGRGLFPPAVGRKQAEGGVSCGTSETELWSYVMQICSALRSIHSAGLAARTLDLSKVLMFGKGRLRLNCVGMMDILNLPPSEDHNHLSSYIHHWQQEDLLAFGRIVLALACDSPLAYQTHNIAKAMEHLSLTYSNDLKNLIMYLFDVRKTRAINDLMPMIGARFFTQLDHVQLRADCLLDQLSKEVECGRIARLTMKLNCILERAEFNREQSWSETGGRYMLKLFRDYVFHAVDENGLPWMDMSHMVMCLNKLDAGLPEKITLCSRDESSIFIVSYAELKRYFTTAFSELLQPSPS